LTGNQQILAIHFKTNQMKEDTDNESQLHRQTDRQN